MDFVSFTLVDSWNMYRMEGVYIRIITHKQVMRQNKMLCVNLIRLSESYLSE